MFSRLSLDHVADTFTDVRGNPIQGAQCRFDSELHRHTGPDAEESPTARAAREQVASEVCETCPLLGDCFRYAIEALPETGIWAGFTAAEIAELSAALDLGEVA